MTEPWKERIPGTSTPRVAYVPLLAPEPGRPVSCWLLCSRVFERELHYDKSVRRTPPCTRSPDCEYCLAGMGTRPTGYTACVEHGTMKLAILQLSEAALITYDGVALVRGDLRGLGVKLARADRRRCSKVLLTTHEDIDPAVLPPDFDPRPVLEYVWGIAAARGIVGRTAGEIAADRQRRRDRKREG